MAAKTEREAVKQRIAAFLKSKRGRRLEHYAAIFAAAAGASIVASAEHLGGIHDVHTLGAFVLAALITAGKVGYDALRQAAIPAVAAYLAGKKG